MQSLRTCLEQMDASIEQMDARIERMDVKVDAGHTQACNALIIDPEHSILYQVVKYNSRRLALVAPPQFLFNQ